jgi:hypothetical protein
MAVAAPLAEPIQCSWPAPITSVEMLAPRPSAIRTSSPRRSKAPLSRAM